MRGHPVSPRGDGESWKASGGPSSKAGDEQTWATLAVLLTPAILPIRNDSRPRTESQWHHRNWLAGLKNVLPLAFPSWAETDNGPFRQALLLSGPSGSPLPCTRTSALPNPLHPTPPPAVQLRPPRPPCCPPPGPPAPAGMKPPPLVSLGRRAWLQTLPCWVSYLCF